LDASYGLFDSGFRHLYQLTIGGFFCQPLHFCLFRSPRHSRGFKHVNYESRRSVEKGLEKGQNFSLHYDFGDDWMFTIHVQKIGEAKEYAKAKVIKQKGEVQQYPDWDDDEDSEEDW
jgi:hypothetical protein